MLIRSQDKRKILDMNCLTITIICLEIIAYGNNNPNDETLINIGTYSTEEKAIKVLDMIQNAYVGCEWTGTHYYVEAQANVPCVIDSKFVFQMPTDEEVEG